jgi:hypothetical protein
MFRLVESKGKQVCCQCGRLRKVYGVVSVKYVMDVDEQGRPVLPPRALQAPAWVPVCKSCARFKGYV